MDERVREGILAVRATGRTNMFDIPVVQRIAMDLGYYDTVIWIEENRKAYCRFIALNTTGAMAAGTGATQLSAAATISDKTQNSVIGLTNTLAEVSPTGYVSRFAPYALILIGGVALLVIAMKKRKHTEED